MKTPRNHGACALSAQRIWQTLGIILLAGLIQRGGTPSVLGGESPPLPPAFAPPVVTQSSNPAATSPAIPTPRIQFASVTNNLDKIVGGQIVKCEFVFTNTGNRTLEVTDVRSSCGCTTAGDWSRKVEPGQTGTIPIQFDSTDFDGPVSKAILISCNDPHQSRVSLRLMGKVWWPIKVTPKSVYMTVTTDGPASAPKVVKITNMLDQPITLSAPESTNQQIKAELKTIQEGKEFQLLVHAEPASATENLRSLIHIKTSSTEMPLLSVKAFALVQDAITVLPAMVALPPGGLRVKASYNVSIRNNGTNVLTLSDPAINAKGVDLQMRETQPGRFYNITLVFPEGFEIAQNDNIELDVKSNHPRFPVIRVPIKRWGGISSK
ncbi:MAG TPA: DUF1573 domain-containing protein [Candidatus Paceibacterota bacterium]|nr:DUF1573 domain-containing protein [Verrucomicrobiota bacterium]HRY50068.1 DUF1573 domain-containing protein [Candidatus Paceibacterota bacterium]